MVSFELLNPPPHTPHGLGQRSSGENIQRSCGSVSNSNPVVYPTVIRENNKRLPGSIPNCHPGVYSTVIQDISNCHPRVYPTITQEYTQRPARSISNGHPEYTQRPPDAHVAHTKHAHTLHIYLAFTPALPQTRSPWLTTILPPSPPPRHQPTYTSAVTIAHAFRHGYISPDVCATVDSRPRAFRQAEGRHSQGAAVRESNSFPDTLQGFTYCPP